MLLFTVELVATLLFFISKCMVYDQENREKSQSSRATKVVVRILTGQSHKAAQRLNADSELPIVAGFVFIVTVISLRLTAGFFCLYCAFFQKP